MAQALHIPAALSKAGWPSEPSQAILTLPARITGLTLVEAEAWLDWLGMHDVQAELHVDGESFSLHVHAKGQ